jgi:hypothetical protein
MEPNSSFKEKSERITNQMLSSLRIRANKEKHSWIALNRKWIFLGIIVLLLAGNPGKRQFKDYIGTNSNLSIRKVHNFLIFSVWEYNDDRYTGFFFNFFKSSD